MNNLLKKFAEYDKDKPQIVKEISGLLGIPINGSLSVEVPNRNSFVYVRLRNNTNELIQAFNEKVSPVYGLPVLVKWVVNRYEVQGRDTSRYQDWGSYSAFLPRHGSQHSLNFEDGQGGDVSFIYSRQFMPFATIPSGTDGAGTVFIMPHVYRSSTNASWNYIGGESSSNFIPAKPTDNTAKMMLLVWDLSTSDPLIITGSSLAAYLTGTADILTAVPTVSNVNYIPVAAIRLVSGTETILWDNIYDLRQFAVTSPLPFIGGIVAQDEGVTVGTGTAINFVGANVEASLVGSTIRVFITGSSGGGSSVFSGVDQIGIFGHDEGAPIGTGTIMNFVGAGVTATRSGTVIQVNVPGGGGGSSGTAFAVYQNTIFDVASPGNSTYLNLNTQVYDPNGIASSNTSGSLVMAQSAWYDFNVQIYFEMVGAGVLNGFCDTFIETDGSPHWSPELIYTVASGSALNYAPIFGYNGKMHINAGEYVNVYFDNQFNKYLKIKLGSLEITKLT